MFDGYIRDYAYWTPRATAVITPSRRVSYADLDADVDRMGAALLDFGIAQDAVVSIDFETPYFSYVLTAALARIGVVSAPADDPGADLRLSDRERRGGPPPLILDPAALADILAAPRRRLPVLAFDREAVGRIMLSSGTTREPRRVGLSWRRLDALNHTVLRTYAVGRVGAWMPVTGHDSLMGLSLMMGAWSIGAAVMHTPHVSEIPRWLETLDGGVMGLTPIQLRAVLAALPPGFTPRPGWRIVSGGSLLPLAVAREARLRISPDVCMNYGATEASMNSFGYATDLEVEPGSLGVTPTGAEVQVIDPEGRPLPDGETGEIRIRGARISHAYVDDPAATAERFRDGWFHPGDAGRRLPEDHPLAGRLVIEGRIDDRMNLGGRKFMPQALEGPALDCPGVLDCAAFAAPGPDGIDRCWLAVTTVPDFDRESLAAHLAKYPDLPLNRFAWIEEIPRNAMGKVERGKLRDALLAAMAPTPAPEA